MAFTPNWLEKLKESIDENKCVTSRLVERGVLRSGLYGIEKNFGNTPSDYNEEAFLEFSNTIKENNQ